MDNNIKTLIRELNRKIKMKGVTGFGKWGWVEKLTGKSDGKHAQLCCEEDKLTTPLIEHKYNCYESYRNEIYLKVVQALEPMYREATSLHTELQILSGTVLPEAGGANAEEHTRQMAKRAAKLSSNEERTNLIRIRMAQIGADITTVDQAVTHNLGRAERLLRSHVGNYWKGILRVKGATEKLPAYPIRPEEIGEGEVTYNQHKDEILGYVSAAVSNTPVNDDRTSETVA